MALCSILPSTTGSQGNTERAASERSQWGKVDLGMARVMSQPLGYKGLRIIRCIISHSCMPRNNLRVYDGMGQEGQEAQ